MRLNIRKTHTKAAIVIRSCTKHREYSNPPILKFNLNRYQTCWKILKCHPVKWSTMPSWTIKTTPEPSTLKREPWRYLRSCSVSSCSSPLTPPPVGGFKSSFVSIMFKSCSVASIHFIYSNYASGTIQFYNKKLFYFGPARLSVCHYISVHKK